eukprot:7375824-Prymnesium_polylepis.1
MCARGAQSRARMARDALQRWASSHFTAPVRQASSTSGALGAVLGVGRTWVGGSARGLPYGVKERQPELATGQCRASSR